MLLSPVERELNEAIDYYAQVSPAISLEFIDEFDRGKSLIAERPEAWTEIDPPVRQFLMSQFPYGILYYLTTEAVVFAALMHLRRKPTYWKARLKAT